MEEKEMLVELEANSKANGAKLLSLLKAYELAKLGYEVQEKESDDCYNQILKENVFLANEDNQSLSIKKGDRITDEEFMFLLSDSDFEKVQKLVTPILVERKIVNEDGYFLTDWLGIETKARKELVEYFIKEIVPVPLRKDLWKARDNYTYQEKLISLIKSSYTSK